MRIFFAGNSAVKDREELWFSYINRRLLSFYYIYNRMFEADYSMEIVKRRGRTKTVEPKIDLFMDSGGFSAMSQNVYISIDEYVDFIKEHQDLLTVYANLDVVGDDEATWKNQKYMESKGLHPLPVFHLGGDVKYLKRYMKKYDYIALGGLVYKSNTRAITPWLDYLFNEFFCNKDGTPLIKIHGFGVASLFLMTRYPWYSVDSTTWVMTSRTGSIFIPKKKNNKWVYDEGGWKICVSSKSTLKAERGKHISTLTHLERKLAQEYLDEIGFSLGKSEFRLEDPTYKLQENESWNGKAKNGKREVEKVIEKGISNEYRQRDEVNILFFLELEKSLPEWPWPFIRKNHTGFDLR